MNSTLLSTSPLKMVSRRPESHFPIKTSNLLKMKSSKEWESLESVDILQLAISPPREGLFMVANYPLLIVVNIDVVHWDCFCWKSVNHISQILLSNCVQVALAFAPAAESTSERPLPLEFESASAPQAERIRAIWLTLNNCAGDWWPWFMTTWMCTPT